MVHWQVAPPASPKPPNAFERFGRASLEKVWQPSKTVEFERRKEPASEVPEVTAARRPVVWEVVFKDFKSDHHSKSTLLARNKTLNTLINIRCCSHS